MSAWKPTDQVIQHARLTEFLRFTGLNNLHELEARSQSDVAWFTDAVLRFLNIRFRQPYRMVLDASRGPEWPRWCAGGRMNIVDSCLQQDDSRLAVIAESEDGVSIRLTYGQLRSAVASLAAHLTASGIKRGDRVAIYLPMRLETVVALLALAWTGAIGVPLFSGYGPAAIETRLNQTDAIAVLTCQGFQHAGKQIPLLPNLEQALPRCPSVRHVITLPYAHSAQDLSEPADTEAEDPLLILFSSGTTGEPKGILHTHCSFPIKAAQDMALNMDVHAGDRISWITDLGWMMGPWLIYGALILGATVVLREGACDSPTSDALWQFAARQQLDVLGLSPSLVRRLMEHGTPHTTAIDLSRLRFFASSGEPWDAAAWNWLFAQVREQPVPIINYSGGTEISGGILSNHPLAPIDPCGFAAPCLGIAADVVDETGQSLETGVGELAIRAPWIGQTRGFWNDPDRYLSSYWSRVPGLWVHGDWAERTAAGPWFIHGRSDDTLKIAGKRLGPGEVEAILCTHPDVREAAAIGVPHMQKGTALVVFCVADARPQLENELRDYVARQLGKPLRPECVHFVPALPKTRNGKIVRRAMRAAYLGDDSGDLSALENPAVLEPIRSLRLAIKEA